MQRLRRPLLFLTVLVIATAGLVYELLAGTVASYVLGDSVRQFSITIGAYLFALGIGSYLSRYVKEGVAARFIEVELATALAGGLSAPLLFIGFSQGKFFGPLLYGTIMVIGTLVGLEIPLLMRILKEELDFEELIARVLTVDYVGALVGSVLFALVLVPSLGLNRTSLTFGLLNCAVGVLSTFVLADVVPKRALLRLRITASAIAVILVAGLVYADRLTTFAEQGLYADPIVYSQQSAYQRVVLTENPHSVQLFLNGNLQFSSADEYRYHEALVHPAFARAPRHSRVLILGGGDGLALREVFRYPDVEHVTMVDLDPAVTNLARQIPTMQRLNHNSLSDPRLTLINADAMAWLRADGRRPFDVVIVDFPDPNNFSLGKLYTRGFYRLLMRVIGPDTALVVQSTSPMYARKSFWCIARTMRSAGFSTHSYHAHVPSFGEWGYVLAMKHPFEPPTQLRVDGLRFLNDATLASLFIFSRDMQELPVRENTLNDQQLVAYYEHEWSLWN
ncbi:MAG: polyamine aminopropyltransferase [Deltaproteobacteria bacterium]|nr:polyamine aminopropyltransferase [Deltaproteobacteria bacterium]